MKLFKKFFGALALIVGLCAGNTAHAGIPVIDTTNLAQQIQQVAAWVQQYSQMAQQIQQYATQIQQLQDEYTSLNGIRGMGNLVNNAGSRKYLPDEWSTILSQGVGQWESIRNAAKVFDLGETNLSGSSDAAKSYEQVAKQAAINRASAEEAYKTASQRFSDIQVLLDKVNDAPDAKDIADLQARVQAEQVMMQNEANKLAMLQQLALAQRDLQMQQNVEINLKARGTTLPAGW